MLPQKIKSLFRFLYEKLVKINDSPQKIAIGFGIGVFLGILPGVGPVASLASAFIFRVNRVAALTGSLLTNTWLSVVTFVAAVKIGALVTGAQWQDVYEQCQSIFKSFHWKDLLNVSLIQILKPLLIGYLVVGLGIGL